MGLGRSIEVCMFVEILCFCNEISLKLIVVFNFSLPNGKK